MLAKTSCASLLPFGGQNRDTLLARSSKRGRVQVCVEGSGAMIGFQGSRQHAESFESRFITVNAQLTDFRQC